MSIPCMYIPESSKDALAGWAAIEDHLLKYDLGKVKDSIDDIDTLLVFVSILHFHHQPQPDH